MGLRPPEKQLSKSSRAKGGGVREGETGIREREESGASRVGSGLCAERAIA